MLDARVASASILRMSIGARGAKEGEGRALATWLPVSSGGGNNSAAGVATRFPFCQRFPSSLPETVESSNSTNVEQIQE
jgi:hypothetical protein